MGEVACDDDDEQQQQRTTNDERRTTNDERRQHRCSATRTSGVVVHPPPSWQVRVPSLFLQRGLTSTPSNDDHDNTHSLDPRMADVVNAGSGPMARPSSDDGVGAPW